MFGGGGHYNIGFISNIYIKLQNFSIYFMIKFLLANNSCFQPAFKINEQLGVCWGGGVSRLYTLTWLIYNDHIHNYVTLKLAV